MNATDSATAANQIAKPAKTTWKKLRDLHRLNARRNDASDAAYEAVLRATGDSVKAHAAGAAAWSATR